MSEPYFPPPKKRDPYREAAPQPIAPKAKTPVIVQRPTLPTDDAPDLNPNVLFSSERKFWNRYSLFARYPRLVGAALLMLGAALSWINVDVLLHGGMYWSNAAVIGAFGLTFGAWLTIVGRPTEGVHERTPDWWKTGSVLVAIMGLAAGIALAVALQGH